MDEHAAVRRPFVGPPVSDASGKTTRTFVCRDPLWDGLTHVATELECTVDYLVNDAIKHYLRQRLVRRPLPPEPNTPAQALTSPRALPLPLPALPPLNPPPLPPIKAPPLPQAQQARVPPPLPPRPSMVNTVRLTAPVTPVSPPRLVVSHGAETRMVSGSPFIIGRIKTSGLQLRDPNVSRQHARVELDGGVYYLVDEGSTNGTWVNGERIQRRAIADGDVAVICDLSVRFSFVH